MKLHLSPSLYRVLMSAVCAVTTTLAAVSSSAYAASLSSGTLTLENGDNAAIRMSGASSDTTNNNSNYNRYDTNNSKITYNGRSFQDGTSCERKTVSTISIAGGGALYLYNRGDGNDFRGTININNATGDSKAVIGTFNTTAADLQIGTLSGSGNLLLRGHNASGTSTFTFGSTSFSGTVYMTANGGAVRVNAGGTGWQNTVFDFTRNADFSDSLIDSTGSAPSAQTLSLSADTTVKGLANGTSSAKVSGAYTLTLGTDEAQNYSYSGNLAADLSVNKTGSNTQTFTAAAELNAVSVGSGSLVFSNALSANTLNLIGGSLTTGANVSLDTANLYGGSTWNLEADLTAAGTTFNIYDIAAGAITFAGEDVNFTAPASINVASTGLTSYNQPLFHLEGVDLTLESDFTLSGFGDDISVGDTIVLAHLGAGSDLYGNSATVSSAAGVFTANVTRDASNQVVLTLTGVEVPSITVNNGQMMWVHRYENESGYADGELEGRLGASYSNNNWTGGTYYHSGSADQVLLSNLKLSQGAQLYLRDGQMSGATIQFTRNDAEYSGNITVLESGGDTPAQIHSEGKTWAVWNFKGMLSGSGDLQLVSHGQDSNMNKWDTVFNFSNFSDPDKWFSGTVSMLSLRGGPVQLNIGRDGDTDTRWRNAVIDLSNPDPTQTSIYDTGSSDRAVGTVLGLTGNAIIKGLTATVGGDGHAVGVSTNITTTGKSYVLTLGANDGSDYTYAGTLGYNRFYLGGHGTPGEGGSNYLNSAAGSLSLTKVGTNTQTFTGASVLGNVTVMDGTLVFDGSLTADSLALLGGVFVNNNTLSVKEVELSSVSSWQMGVDTATNATIFKLNDLNAGNIAVSGSGNNVTWTMSGDLQLNDYQHNYSDPFIHLEHLNLNVGSFLSISGLDSIEGADRIAIFSLDDGYNFTVNSENDEAVVSLRDGSFYTGTLVEENGIVYIQNLALDARWPVPMDPANGYIWSGEAENTRPGGYDHRTLVLGNVWRADGSAENTGWHEQAVAGGMAGVYVNGNFVTFADTNIHGDTVTAPGRDVHLIGNVAPGSIYVTANDYVGEVSNGGEARMKYGYAFVSPQGDGRITDILNDKGEVVAPTSIIKSGKALLVLDAQDSTFSGGVEVQQGGLYVAAVNATGTGALTFHTDRAWEIPIWNSVDGKWVSRDKNGGELMVCYLHSNEHASAFRSGTITNDIVLKQYETGNNAGSFTVSFAFAGFNLTADGGDFSNTPRHWRNLTLSGALVGTGNKNDELVLTGYSSTWGNYRDCSYVTSFMLNERTKGDFSLESNFNGTVVLKNTINTSPLETNRLNHRTAGTVQVILQDRKMQYAHMNLTRESIVMTGVPEHSDYEGQPRQTYNSILVLNGEVGVRGLSANFLGSGHYYLWEGDPEDYDGQATRSYIDDMKQNDEVWHVRTVANATATLRIGDKEDDSSSVYVYSGAMGFAQSYVEPTQAAVLWGDGFDNNPTSATDAYMVQYGPHSMGYELLSLVKKSASTQYIHTAKLHDVSLDAGLLGFNNLDLTGNMTIVGGSNLKLGVTGSVGSQNWDYISADTTSDLLSTDKSAYAVAPTSADVNIRENNSFVVFIDEPTTTPYLPTAAVVDGNVVMNTGSGLFFEVNNVEPWFHEFPENTTLSDYTATNPLPANTHGPSEYMLLDVNGKLNLMSSTADMEIRFRGVNFSLTPFSDRLYYLAEADEITVGTADSSEFASRLISLGYGYFGMVDTLDSSNAAHNTAGKDYLVMTVMGDPRHTWSGATELTNGTFEWVSYSDTDADAIPKYDYHWKENTPFMNGHVVLFGNLYNPAEWEEKAYLTSDDTVRVLTQGSILTEKGSTLDGHQVLLDGTVANSNTSTTGVIELSINNLDEKERFFRNYQKVHVGGEVAPLSVIINSEYLDVTDGVNELVTTDSTNYWFYGDGFIRDASASELSDMFSENADFDGGQWKTNLEKYGNGIAVINLDNSFSGGTKLYGGKIVMQHKNALGSGAIYIVNGATLQGDFADDRTAADWHGYDGAYIGEGMETSTVHNPVEVRLNIGTELQTESEVDARLSNAVDKKMVLTQLSGDANTVVTLHGYSAPADMFEGMYPDDIRYSHDGENHRPAYTYAIFKVLDPSGFYGTIRMDGNIWGQEADMPGGNVQLEIMTTDKSTLTSGQALDDSQKKDWLNTNIDLSVNNGTNRTVLALDAIDAFADGSAAPDSQEALINSLNGTGSVRMADGSINSSVLNMSEDKSVVLVIKGLTNGDYDGVLGYGEFQRSTDYGTDHRADIPAVGETCHHYGCGNLGDLSVRKEGNTTQSVYNAWLHRLEVTGGTFAVDHALQVNSIVAGGGTRVFVGSVTDLNTVYALTVGKNGILSMDTRLFEPDSTVKFDAFQTLSAGTDNEGIGSVGWVQLQNGATITAHSDWYTGVKMEIQSGSTVTFNTHNYTPDPFITSDHAEHAHVDENGTAHDHFNHFFSSHIIQLLGDLSGNQLNLIFNNEQICPGANASEQGKADAMGYVAIKDHNQMTGKLTVKEQTVLQVLNSNSANAAMNATVTGTDAAMQIVEATQTQYINKLTVDDHGTLLLGGSEKTTLGSGDSVLTTIDYAAEGIQMSAKQRFNGDADNRGDVVRPATVGTMSSIHTDLSGAGVRIGGTDTTPLVADNMHITAHTGGVTHELHNAEISSSLVDIRDSASLNININVYIDDDSIVCGRAGIEQTLTAPAGSLLEDFTQIAPAAATETANTGSTTTVELTVSGGTLYKTGNTGIYHVYADQFHNVNIDGTGLHLKLTNDHFIYRAYLSGADFIAIQVSGEGRFLFEDHNADAFDSANWTITATNGDDISSYWVTSDFVSESTGLEHTSYMLYLAVPEPATATLSLLALSALAMRRRRCLHHRSEGPRRR